MSSNHSKTNVMPAERDDIVNWAAEILEKQRNYLNVKVLGSGTFGDVRLVRDSRTDSLLAAKVVQSKEVSEGELYLWPMLHHPNVVPLLELLHVGENREVTIFVMPVQSRTLIDALFEWYIVQLDNVPMWMHDILQGLEYLHSKNMCHLDIKTDNVLISGGKVAKLCDFTFLNQTTKTLTRRDMGNPAIYAPPEKCKSLGDAEVDGKACDMWSFGVMCLKVLVQFRVNCEDGDSWLKSAYPAIFRVLQEGRFFRLMHAAFLCAKINRAYSRRALDFVHGFLRIDGERRVSASEALQHSFLKRGTFTGNAPDAFWIQKVTDDDQGIEIFKKKCLKNQYTKEEDKTEIDKDSESSRSDAKDSVSQEDGKQVCNDVSSIPSDKNGNDLVEEEAEHDQIEETSERQSNSDAIEAITPEEGNNRPKSHETIQKRRRPRIARIVRWMAKRFRGTKGRTEACAEEIHANSRDEPMECEMEERTMSDCHKESTGSSSEKLASEIDEKLVLEREFSLDNFEKDSASHFSAPKSSPAELPSMSVETTSREEIKIQEDSVKGDVSQVVSEIAANEESFLQGNTIKNVPSSESGKSWETIDTDSASDFSPSSELQSISFETTSTKDCPTIIKEANLENSGTGEPQVVSDISASGETFIQGDFQKSSAESEKLLDEMVETAQFEMEGKVLERRKTQDDAESNTHDTAPFCAAAWDSFLCWPPLPSGEQMSKPCPQMDARGVVIGDAAHPGMFAVRACADNGSWIENRTNFSLCMTNIATLYPSAWAPTIVALIVVVCSVISIITLSITLFIFCYFNCLKCSRLKVHRNLSIALLLNLVLLIVTSSPVLVDFSYRQTEWACRGVLVLQLYSGMCSINWMFVEGLLLHSRVTVHIFKQDAPFKLYYCIGWVVPAFSIGIWCILMYHYHNTPCWSGYGDLPYIWVITGPMLVALLVNSLFLVDIIRVLVGKRHANFANEANRCALYDGMPPQQQQKMCPWPHGAQPPALLNACGRKKAIKATALLFPLLGIPHLLFCINPKDNGRLEEAYMIANAFVKSSQGLFVSVLYCFMNNDVQTALRKAYMRAVVRRNPNHKYTCRTRGLSQTSGTYLSHSDGNLLSDARHKTSKTVLRLKELPSRGEPSTRSEYMTVIF